MPKVLPDYSTLIGKRVVCESKRPGRDIQDVSMAVSAVLDIPGVAVYLFGVSTDGNVGIHNTKFFFVDSLKVSPEKNFKPQTLDGWYLVPAENGKFDAHYAYAERVSERAMKRLPKGAMELKAFLVA